MNEPERIDAIASRVLAGIAARRQEHRHSVVQAVSAFLAGKSKPKKEYRAGKKERNGLLW
jgi:hypothetical protein